MAMMVYAGEVEAGERAIAPFRALAAPIAELVADALTRRSIRLTRATPARPRRRARSSSTPSTSTPAIDRRSAGASTAPRAVAQLRVLGGAMARVPADAPRSPTAGVAIMVNLAASTSADEAAAHEAWDRLRSGVATGRGRGVYVNFLGDEGEARVREAYPGATWDRLAGDQGRYDPTNLFRLNQNSPPLPLPSRPPARTPPGRPPSPTGVAMAPAISPTTTASNFRFTRTSCEVGRADDGGRGPTGSKRR